MWRIRNWDEIFENSQSRKYATISWVPIPNKHDSDGYTQLLEHDHGVQHYGAWIALVQVASRCRPRGLLTRGEGRPHDAQSLARITRIGAHVFAEAIPRFLSEEIGWLENVDGSDASGSVPVACYPEQNRKEQKRTEKKFRPAGGPVGILEDWDSENWVRARLLAKTAVQKLWPNRQSKLPIEDRDLLGKAAYIAVTRLSEAWFASALDETIGAKPKKPAALFKTILWKRPRSDGIDLNALLDSVMMPEQQPHARSPDVPPLDHIGAMPK